MRVAGRIDEAAVPAERILRALREAGRRLEEETGRRAEPVAVTGMACRFPGGADDPEAFWRLLIEGRDAVGELPAARDRLVGGAWSRRVPPRLRRGGFLAEVDGFDAPLFGIAPAEAEALDPQQRLLLETAWEALEDAGLPPRGLRGRAAGVWVGIGGSDYLRSELRRGDRAIDAYSLTGSALSVAAGRLAYVFGLRGPALAVDTACSSSLVALHLAMQSLRAGECDLALVGGVQLILDPEIAIGLDRMAALSPSGRCSTFDAAADGFVRGEGCAVVVLRRAGDAHRGGEAVRALLLGSAVNQDGATSGLTAPNGGAQQEVIRAALAGARLDPGAVDYLEAHGTGTALGDPIELNALRHVFAARSRPLAIGSVKTNLGHLEAAAGLAGVIKTVLALEHGMLPPHLHLAQPTPHFDWADAPFEIPTRPRPWPPGERPRAAGVSAFGWSGTNAHVIVGEAPPAPPARIAPLAPMAPTAPPAGRPLEILPLAAGGEAALAALQARWAARLAALPAASFADACHVARCGRSHLTHRRVWLAGSAAEAAELLLSPASPPELAAAAGAAGTGAGGQGVVWMFDGQAAQYPGMARRLYETEPAFRRELDLCGEVLAPALGGPLPRLLFAAGAEDLAQTGLAQPAICAVELALASLWQSWGLAPALVLGHSIGEIAAAQVAGVFSREDALLWSATRGRLMQALPAGGGMAAVAAGEERAAGLLAPFGGRLVVAAVNGPAAVTVSGPAADLDALLARLAAEGIRGRRLAVSHAFHSPLMAPAEEELRQAARRLDYREPHLPMVSALSGATAAAGDLMNPEYWVAQALRPVRFAAALAAAAAAGHRRFMAIGPGAALAAMGGEALPGPGRLWLSSLRKGTDDRRHLLATLGQLYVSGVDVDWQAFDAGRNLRSLHLPTYAFDRRSYWRHAALDGAAPLATEPPSVASAGAAVAARPELPAQPGHTANDGSPHQDRIAAQGGAAPDPAAPRTQETGMEDGAAHQRMLALLEAILARVGGPPPGQIDVDENVFRLGLDSIMLIQARQIIGSELGVDLELSRFYDEASTLDRMAAYVLARAPLPPPAAGVIPAAPPATAAAPPTAAAQPPAGPPPAGAPLGLPAIAAQLTYLGRELAALAAVPAPPVEPPATLAGPVGAPPSVASTQNAAELPSVATPPSTAMVAAPPPSPATVAGAGAAPAPTVTAAEPPPALPNRPGRSSASAEMAARQRRHLEGFAPRYVALTAASKRLAAQHRPVFASSRNLAGFRPEWKELSYQLAGGRGEGARIWDADGRPYRDFTMGFGTALLGHAPACVRRALAREVERGMPLGPLSDLAGDTAALLCDLTGVERVAFFNTGSEAVMNALRIARTVVGRPKVALFAGSYHGTFDGVLALGTGQGAVPISPGTPPAMVGDLLVLPYDDARALDLIARHAGELAAVLVEPVQSRRPSLQPRGFVHELRQLTERLGVALILDEMITGFRCHPAGIQGLWGLRADLVTYGKILGGGLPVGAVAGRARFLDAVDGGAWAFGDDSVPGAATTFTSGTFCNHPLAMAAGGAVLAELRARGPALQARLDAMSERLCRTLDDFYAAEGMPLRMARFSSLFRFVFAADLELLFFHLLARGFYLWEGRNCFLSAAHTDEDVDAFVAAVIDSLREMRAAGLVPEARTPPPVAAATIHGNGRRDTAPREPAAPPPPPAEDLHPKLLPASPAQRRLFVLDHLGGAEAAYQLRQAVVVHGPFDAPRWRAALDAVVARHASLRTGFELLDGEPVQRIHGHLAPEVEILDLPGAEPRGLIPSLLRPFDLARPPLLRMHLARLAPQRHLVVLDAHHIICDGQSLDILFAEMLALYGGATLPPPPRQYADFAAWHLDLLASPAIQRQEDFWLARFAGEVPVLDLPADRSRSARLTFAGGVVRADLDAAATGRLRQAARGGGATLYTLLLASYQTLLYRLSGQRDLVVGTPVAGRPDASFAATVGMFVATLPLRARIDPAAAFAAHLQDATRDAFAAFDHADYPFERLVARLALARDAGRNPLFDTMFEYETAVGDPPAAAGLRFEPLDVAAGTTLFDLDVEAALTGERLRLAIKYRTDLFDAPTAARFLRCWTHLLASVAADARQSIAALPLLDAVERRQVLREWNDTAAAFPAASLHGLIARRARRSPRSLALIADEGTLTYGELDLLSDRLARRLRAAGLGPERFAGIFMERSRELIVAYLGVLKAGAAYVPLDPDYPARRIELLWEELGRPLVLAEERLAPRLPATIPAERVLAIDRAWRWLAGWEGTGLPAAGDAPAGQPAYALFTSGSTGQPKCVVVPHGAIVNHTLWYIRELGITDADVFLQKTVFTFDTSLTEVYAALVAGARLVLPRPREHADPAYVVGLIQRHGVTILEDVPSFAELLVEEPGFAACRTLRWHNPGGEALPNALVRRVLARLGVRMVNLYGPTEAAVDAVFEICEPEPRLPGPMAPIGRPVANVRAYVLDEAMQPVPIGVAGELYLAGDSLARGYLGRPEATAERFLPDPLAGAPGGRLYRTGDLARWLPYGDVAFLGRVDQQVKVRGQRVELGEIEAALAAHPGIEAAAVVQRPAAGGARLVAYVVAARPPAAGNIAADLVTHLRERLPSYMIPGAFVELPNLPLTPSGKLDRKALPEPAAAAAAGELGGAAGGAPGAGAAQTEARRRPRNPAEEIVAGVFAELLGVAVGRDDDFFLLGGHSLLATRAISRLRLALGAELPLRALFENPTPAGLAAAARGAAAPGAGAGSLPPVEPTAAAAPGEDGFYPLSAGQRGIWADAQMRDDAAGYNMAAAYRFDGDLDVAALRQAVAAVVERHEILRTVFPAPDGEPRQQVLARPAWLEETGALALFEWRPSGPWDAALAICRREMAAPFDLQRGPLMRVLVLELEPRRHIALFNLHHLVFDAWSSRVLIEDLLALYTDFAAGRPARLAPPRLQYRDYALWQQRLFSGVSGVSGVSGASGASGGTGVASVTGVAGDPLAAARQFWHRRLTPPPPPLGLATDRPRPRRRSLAGAQAGVAAGAGLTTALRRLAAESAATLFMTLQAAVKVLLFACTGRRDIAVGTLTAGRGDEALAGQIGLFLNTLVLRDSIDPQEGFRALLARVRDTTLAAFDHQVYPYDRLVGELRTARVARRQPLFEVMVNMLDGDLTGADLADRPADPGRARWHGLEVSRLEIESGDAKFDLTWQIQDHGDRLDLTLEYSTDLFAADSMARLAARFGDLLSCLAASPDEPLGAIVERPLDDQPPAVPVERPRGRRYFDVGAGVHQEFARHAAARPQAPALSAAGETLAYGELEARANRLARHLRRRGVGRESLVGLCLERSPALIESMLAVLKAGGAYLPLDPAYPAEQLAFVLADSAARWVITAGTPAAALSSGTGAAGGVGVVDLVDLDDPAGAAAIAGESAAPLDLPCDPDQAAYVIYTSGSTGRPKGCVVTHRNLGRLFAATAGSFRFGPDDVFTLFHSPAFDFSAWEIWGALAHGARLVVVPYWTSRSPELFAGLLRAEGVTVLNQTPSAFYPLLDHLSPPAPPALDKLAAAPDDLAAAPSAPGAATPGQIAATPGETAPTPDEAALAPRPCAGSLRVVIFGGEALDLRRLAPLLVAGADGPRLVNMYGITETTVHVTYRPVTAADTVAKVAAVAAVPTVATVVTVPTNATAAATAAAGAPGAPGALVGAPSGGSFLGEPLCDLEVHVLGADLEPLPPGVAGEIWVAGAGVSRGYLGRPALTAERFLPNPFAGQPGERMYRSGDLARRTAGGDLEYLGRADHQLKIRGFRIEPGEVEAALLSHPRVRRALVLAVPAAPAASVPGPGTAGAHAAGTGHDAGSVHDAAGFHGAGVQEAAAGPRLAACLETTGPIAAGELRRHLQERLPAHMVPAVFVCLAAFPSTANGKVDRQALAARAALAPAAAIDAVAWTAPGSPPAGAPGSAAAAGGNGTDVARDAAAPSAAVLLASIWEQVLGRAPIGPQDDFFDLGGDSILAIQVLSRAARHGLRLTTQDLFENPTPAALAAVAVVTAPPRPAAAMTGPVGSAIGEVLPTPIQSWFFALGLERPGHWNQALLLRVRGAGRALLARALRAVGEHHDALRLRARRSGGAWQLDLPAAAPPLALRRVDLADLPAAERLPMLERCAAQVQTELDLAAGRPAAAVLFHLGGGEDDRLLLVIHHLAVDGVSWRILVEDLETVCRQLQAGEALALPPGTTTVQEWGARLREHLGRPAVAAEIDHWMAVTARSGALDLDDPRGDDTVAAERSLTVRLAAPRTGQLLVEAPRAYQNRVEELLLAALLRVFCQRPGRPGLRLDLERHGRAPIAADVDLSRTVGWLTALFPVWLELPRRGEPGDLLKAVKEQLRAVPGDGLGFGLLRYLRDDPRLAAAPASAIVFNYHGRIDPVERPGGFFTLAAPSPGALHDPGGRRPHELEITGAVVAGELELTWSWSAARLRPATVEGWALRHLAAIEELVRHCLEPGAAGYTPSDFPEAGFDQEDLEDFLRRLPEPEV